MKRTGETADGSLRSLVAVPEGDRETPEAWWYDESPARVVISLPGGGNYVYRLYRRVRHTKRSRK